MDLDPSGEFLYVISQRVCQTPTNENPEGNILHTFKVDGRGLLRVVDSRPLGPDGVPSRSRPQGVATL